MLQRFLRDLRLDVLQLDDHIAAGGSRGQLLAGGLQVKAEAHHFLGDGVGLLVVCGVLDLDAVLVIIGLQVHRLAGDLPVGPGHGGEVAVHKGVVDGVIEAVGVQGPVGIAHMDGQGALLLVIVHGGGLQGLFHLGGHLVDEIADIVRVQVQHGLQIDIMLRLPAVEIAGQGGEGIAAAAVGQGLVNGLVGVQRHVGLLRVEGQGPVRQAHVQGGRRIGGGHGGGHGIDGLLPAHAADVDSGHIDVGIDGTAVFQNQAVNKHAQSQDHHQSPGHNGRDGGGIQTAARLLRLRRPGRLGGRLGRTLGLGRPGRTRLRPARGLLRRRGPRLFKFTFLSDGNRSYLSSGIRRDHPASF